VDVVGGDEGKPEFAGQRDQLVVVLPLPVGAVPHHLDEEVLAQQLPVEPRGLHGAAPVPGAKRMGHLTLEAPREHDEPLVVGGEGLPVDAGVVVEAVHIGGGGEADEVPPAGVVPGEHGDVVGGHAASGVAAAFRAGTGGHVHLAAHDGPDPGLLRRPVEGEGPEQVAVVRQGDGAHVPVGGGPDQTVHAGRPVEEREVAVDVEVDEFGQGRSW